MWPYEVVICWIFLSCSKLAFMLNGTKDNLPRPFGRNTLIYGKEKETG